MSTQWSSFPVRLLSSVAVVGRDNEPIYLRGSLSSDSIFSTSPFVASTNNKRNDDDQPPPAAAAAAAAASSAVEERAEWSGSDDGDEGDNGNNNNNNNEAEENASSSNNKPGLFGRIKGAVIRKNDEGDTGDADAATSTDKKYGHNSNTTNVIDDDDDDDPFGFFGSSSSSSSSSQVDNIMSLTQQLVLHASLDRFEEKMTSTRSNNNVAARWRSPGAMGTNAMWMGMLCEVEERLRLYGYITNTGIKFILLLEIIHMNEDGSSSSRCHDLSSLSSVSSSLPSRETELKHMFAQLHDLYVRYTMNPFTKLRGPIKSRVFDQGIGEIARSFNSSAIEQAVQNGEANNGEGLAWM